MVMLATAEAGMSTFPTSRTTNNSPASLGNRLSRKRTGLDSRDRVDSEILHSHHEQPHPAITTTSRSTTSAAKFDTKELEEEKDKRLVKKFKAYLHGHCYKKTSLPTISTPITASTTRSTTFAAKFDTKEYEERKHKRLVKDSKEGSSKFAGHGNCYKHKRVCFKTCKAPDKFVDKTTVGMETSRGTRPLITLEPTICQVIASSTARSALVTVSKKKLTRF